MWEKGESGNLRGRPRKGNTLADAMRKLLAEEHPDGGKNLTAKELLISLTFRRAMEGNMAALKLIWNYVDGMPPSRDELAISTDPEMIPDFSAVTDEELQTMASITEKITYRPAE